MDIELTPGEKNNRLILEQIAVLLEGWDKEAKLDAVFFCASARNSSGPLTIDLLFVDYGNVLGMLKTQLRNNPKVYSAMRAAFLTISEEKSPQLHEALKAAITKAPKIIRP